MAVARWTDDGLDDLARRIYAMEPTVVTVAVLEERMNSLSRELRANAKSQERVSEQLGELSLEPLKRGQALRGALVVAVAAAVVGGGLAILGTLLAGAH
jgi:hypothetical protein